MFSGSAPIPYRIYHLIAIALLGVGVIVYVLDAQHSAGRRGFSSICRHQRFVDCHIVPQRSPTAWPQSEAAHSFRQ